MRPLTKIYFIVLFSSFITVSAQDTVYVDSKQHLLASLQAGSTFLPIGTAGTYYQPISALYFTYIPKRSKIILSIGPSFSPAGGLAFFGGGINAKMFLRKIAKHNLVFEMGDQQTWSQEKFVYGSSIVSSSYRLNNLYFGSGYLIFLSKAQKFFLSITGAISINYFKGDDKNFSGGHSSELSSFSSTTISQAILIQAGMKLK